MIEMLLKQIYRISSKKRPHRLFNFGALRYGAYWWVELKRERHLFQIKSKLFKTNFKTSAVTGSRPGQVHFQEFGHMRWREFRKINMTAIKHFFQLILSSRKYRRDIRFHYEIQLTPTRKCGSPRNQCFTKIIIINRP